MLVDYVTQIYISIMLYKINTFKLHFEEWVFKVTQSIHVHI